MAITFREINWNSDIGEPKCLVTYRIECVVREIPFLVSAWTVGHVANNHEGTNNTDPFVFWVVVGELFPDDNVKLILLLRIILIK